MRSPFAAMIICMVLAFPASAGELTGKPRIVDGDSIDLVGPGFGTRRIDLAGIHAPAPGQTCFRGNGAVYPCGQMATFALAGIVETQWVTCRETGPGENGAAFAVCTIGPYDIGAEMVRRGWAVADRRASDTADAYVSLENAARAARLGLWDGTFELPGSWPGN